MPVWGWLLAWVALLLGAAGYLGWRCWGLWRRSMALVQELATLTQVPVARP